LVSDGRVFTDDTNLTFADHHPDKLISVLNDDLKTLQNWLNLNKQSLNAIKTKCMFIAGMSAGHCRYSSSTKSFTKECMHQQLFYNNSAGIRQAYVNQAKIKCLADILLCLNIIFRQIAFLLNLLMRSRL
jgi:hypothetical protein